MTYIIYTIHTISDFIAISLENLWGIWVGTQSCRHFHAGRRSVSTLAMRKMNSLFSLIQSSMVGRKVCSSRSFTIADGWVTEMSPTTTLSLTATIWNQWWSLPRLSSVWWLGFCRMSTLSPMIWTVGGRGNGFVAALGTFGDAMSSHTWTPVWSMVAGCSSAAFPWHCDWVVLSSIAAATIKCGC